MIRTSVGIATILLGLAGCSQNSEMAVVYPNAQTDHIILDDDVADDSAVWINPNDSSKSRIIGTHKKGGGLEVYTLKGNRVQNLPDGKLNNVDIRYGFEHNNTVVDLVIASNRDDDTLAVYGMSAQTMKLAPLSLNELSTLDKSYGFCMHKNSKDEFFAITNSKKGDVVMQRIDSNGTHITAHQAGKAKVPSQTEGCVVDDATHTLYIGEENRGIWSFDISKGLSDNGVMIIDIKEHKNIEVDIEGLALYNNYLIASSQGNDSYAVFDKRSAKYLGSFKIEGKDGIDGTSETDGIEAISVPVGEYTHGIFVAQDDKTPKKGQNFKIVDFKQILDGLSLEH